VQQLVLLSEQVLINEATMNKNKRKRSEAPVMGKVGDTEDDDDGDGGVFYMFPESVGEIADGGGNPPLDFEIFDGDVWSTGSGGRTHARLMARCSPHDESCMVMDKMVSSCVGLRREFECETIVAYGIGRSSIGRLWQEGKLPLYNLNAMQVESGLSFDKEFGNGFRVDVCGKARVKERHIDFVSTGDLMQVCVSVNGTCAVNGQQIANGGVAIVRVGCCEGIRITCGVTDCAVLSLIPRADLA